MVDILLTRLRQSAVVRQMAGAAASVGIAMAVFTPTALLAKRAFDIGVLASRPWLAPFAIGVMAGVWIMLADRLFRPALPDWTGVTDRE